jgi:hypothetical protein
MVSGFRRPLIEIVFEESGAATAASRTLETVSGVESVSVDGSTVVLGSELTLAQILGKLDGYADQVASIGHTRPKLRDVLEQMLRPGQDQP